MYSKPPRGSRWRAALQLASLLMAVRPVVAQPPAPGEPEPPPQARASEASTVADTSDAPSKEPLFHLLPRAPPSQGGLTAAAAAERAVAVAPRTLRAHAEARYARQRADRAYALLLPRVDLGARYARLSDVPVPAEFAEVFPILLNTYSLRAAVQVPVSDYLATLRARYAAAQKLAAFGELSRQGELQAVAYDATREYYQLASAIAAQRLSVHRVAQLSRFTEEIRILVEGGERGSADLAQARARLASAQAAATRQLSILHVAEQILRRRLKLESDAPVGIGEVLAGAPAEAPRGLDRLIALAQQQRPEARALAQLIAAREHGVAAAKAARYPTLSAFGDVDMANPNQRYVPLRDEFKTTWRVGVELGWSATDLAFKQNALDGKRLEVTQAQSDLEALHDRIAIEVTEAYENARAAISTVATSQVAVEAAQETYRVHVAFFRAGESTSREVLDAEIELRAAQLEWVDAILSTHLSLAALKYATGDAQVR